jgi:hypothetical protein
VSGGEGGFASALKANARSRRLVRVGCLILLGAMLCVDVGFIAGSSVMVIDGKPVTRWHVSVDGGYPERWQYLKWGIMTIMMMVMAFKKRSTVYLVWSVIFLYLLLDDSQMIHEVYGQRIASWLQLQPAFGLRAQDFGELIVTGIAAGLLLSLLALAYFRTPQNEARTFTHGLLILMVALAFFGVAVDMLDIITVPWPLLSKSLEIVEDGGEMVVASAIVAYVVHHELTGGAPGAALLAKP